MPFRAPRVAALILGGLAASVLACPTANAATVTSDVFLQCSYPGADCDTATAAIRMVFRAAPGEVNQVTVSRVGTDVVVHDASAAVTVKPGVPEAGVCAAVDEHSVSCPVGSLVLPDGELAFTSFATYLGDRDDSIDFATGIFPGNRYLAHYAQIFGGPGDDVIRSTAAPDYITPGTGHDTVSALGGNDVVRAVDRERDRIDCGGARDNRAHADRVDVVRHCQHLTRPRAPRLRA
jgi:Ca2+-binding RTX toxin-like protein